jgi:four helix bundle protein
MRFEALEVSIVLIRQLRPVLGMIRKHDYDLYRQRRRAATSTPLNLAEGAARAGADAKHHYRIARGSAKEVQAGLRVAEAWQYVAARQLALPMATLDRLLAILWGLR